MSLEHYEKVVEDVFEELRFAEGKFPAWPDDPRHACLVVAEECGELVCAVNDRDAEYGKSDQSSDEKVYKEAIQTAAMALRFAFHEKASKG